MLFSLFNQVDKSCFYFQLTLLEKIGRLGKRVVTTNMLETKWGSCQLEKQKLPQNSRVTFPVKGSLYRIATYKQCTSNESQALISIWSSNTNDRLSNNHHLTSYSVEATSSFLNKEIFVNVLTSHTDHTPVHLKVYDNSHSSLPFPDKKSEPHYYTFTQCKI